VQNLLDRTNALVQHLAKWTRKHGVWGVTAVAGVTALVLFSGVGVTMAATGGLQSIFVAPTASPTFTATPSPSGNASVALTTGAFPDGLDPNISGLGVGGSKEQLQKLMASGWIGAKVAFYPGGLSIFHSGVSGGVNNPGRICDETKVNGIPGANGCATCSTNPAGGPCPGTSTGALLVYSENAPNDLCRPGGDKYWVHVWGSGIEFTESGTIPPDMVKGCPLPQVASPPLPVVTQAPVAPPAPVPVSSPGPSAVSGPSASPSTTP
jgi:hypothetical protein